jgi:hypothetical protein
MWGNEIGEGYIHREDVGMFFENNYYRKDILPLFSFSCIECPYTSEIDTGKKKTQIKALQEHLRSQHRKSLCQLCVDNKRDFVASLPRMTQKQLTNHLKNGDGPASGFFGHPVCEFCKPKRFYDLAALHEHLHKEHYECHVCKKQGIENQFFKNYKSLERHFDQQHFLCHDPQCLAARFVVFENEIDLQAHELSVHGGTSSGSTKINLEFRTRRVGYDGSGFDDQQALPSENDFNYGLDGQAFVPASLPNQIGNNNFAGGTEDDSRLHPLHVQRTEELRAQAVAIREQNAAASQGEAFPSLQSATAAASSAPLVGWASASTRQRFQGPSRDAGKVTEEDYPTLPTASNTKANAKKKAVRRNIGVINRQFSTMQTPSSSYGAAASKAQFPIPSLNSLVGPTPTVVASLNIQANLAPTNFPSLGAASGRAMPYAAANAFAKKNLRGRTSAPSINSTTDFPSMASTIRPPARKVKPAPMRTPSVPASSSTIDFPPPPSVASNKKISVRQQIMGNSKQSSHHQAMSNVLQTSTPSASATAAVQNMKGSLGPKKFKELKRMTKEFSENKLSAEGYVDQSAALFDKGYGDDDFWSFLPSLLQSCPNEEASMHALKYMSSLKRQTMQQLTRTAVAVSSWGGNVQSNMIKATPRIAATRKQALTQPVIGRQHTAPSHKSSAWGGGGKATVVRAKAQPGFVSAAAALQGPQGGSATKFMAKQQKKKVSQQQQNRKKNKKKERDELKALAFGN